MIDTADFDVIVIGAGPAGLSAALVLGRARRCVLVVDGGPGRNWPTAASHGFLTQDGTPPDELRRIGREQLAPYDVRVVSGRASRVRRLGPGVSVSLDGDPPVTASALVLATGMRDHLPPVAGFDEVYGLSAHHCPHCDGWEWRDRPLAAYAPDGGADYAAGLKAWSDDVTLLTDGRPLPRRDADALRKAGVAVRTDRVRSLSSQRGMLSSVDFEVGASLPIDALFFHLGMEQASDIPRSLGCALDQRGFVRVDEACRTSVGGVYAAGDMTPGPQSVAAAVAEGSKAGAAAHHDLWRSRAGARR